MSSCLFKLALLSIYFYQHSVPLGTLLPPPPEPGPGHQPQTHQETPVLEGRHGKILELGPQCLPFVKHLLPVNHYGRFPKPQTTEINVTRATGQSGTRSIAPAKGRCVHTYMYRHAQEAKQSCFKCLAFPLFSKLYRCPHFSQ